MSTLYQYNHITNLYSDTTEFKILLQTKKIIPFLSKINKLCYYLLIKLFIYKTTSYYHNKLWIFI